MKNLSKNTLSKAVWGLVMGLFLAGPVFGNEPAAEIKQGAEGQPAPVEAKAPESKPEVKQEKGGKKNRKGKKHHKVEKVEKAPETAPAPVVPETK